MKWKIGPLDFDIVFFFQPFNTTCTEITPRSYKIGEHFNDNLAGHFFSLILLIIISCRSVNSVIIFFKNLNRQAVYKWVSLALWFHVALGSLPYQSCIL